MTSNLTRQERHLVALMQFLMVVSALLGVLFALYPNGLLEYFTQIGHHIFGWEKAHHVPEQNLFWLIPTIALMGVLAYLSYLAQQDIVQNLHCVVAVLLSKGLAAAGFIATLLSFPEDFIYLVGAVFDGSLTVVIGYAYVKAHKSRAR